MPPDLSDMILSLDVRAAGAAEAERRQGHRLRQLLDGRYVTLGLGTTEPDWAVAPPRGTRVVEKLYRKVEGEADTIAALLSTLDNHPARENVEYSMDLESLRRARPYLQELDSMVGVEMLKQSVLDQVMYYAQGLHRHGSGSDYMHTVVFGPPGTGKTEIARIIGKVFAALGVLSKGTFKKVTRSDLVAGFLGQTALRTREVVEAARGGVLFIDEAYALGNAEKRDSFAKECIDTLCEALSDRRDDLMVIVAGYKDELESCFFSYNAGLASRFVWRFETQGYGAAELRQICEKLVRDGGWSCTLPGVAWFADRLSSFTGFGRDMQQLVTKARIAHARRLFTAGGDAGRGFLTPDDIEGGYRMLVRHESKPSIATDGPASSMYV